MIDFTKLEEEDIDDIISGIQSDFDVHDEDKKTLITFLEDLKNNRLNEYTYNKRVLSIFHILENIFKSEVENTTSNGYLYKEEFEELNDHKAECIEYLIDQKLNNLNNLLK